MNPTSLLPAEKAHLAQLLTAVQRSAYFLAMTERRLAWPLTAEALMACKLDQTLYERLAAINERYAKLQDSLGAAMRHACLLLAERCDDFLQVLAYFEKQGVIESVEGWQAMRVVRNIAAHEYEIDYARVADHFNTVHALVPELIRSVRHFVRFCAERLGVGPADQDFAQLFAALDAEG